MRPLLALGIASAALAQTFPLADPAALTPVNVHLDPAEFKGRKAVRLTMDGEKPGFALLRDVAFQDGTIEADIALKSLAPPGARFPGFVGIAFRARPDASHYELIYLRPGNSHFPDQSMRNHSLQYSSEPDFGWSRLRRAWPWVYESWADLQMETWTKVKVVVKGRDAALYLNGSADPSLVIEGLKGEDLSGGIALWGYPGEESYFANLRVTPAPPAPVKNGSDAAGTWQIRFATDNGAYGATLRLQRDGTTLTGTCSGDLGDARPVRGAWRNGYVELAFDAEWPKGAPGPPGPAAATFAGWIDGDSATGRVSIQGRADGRWSAARKTD